MNAKTIERVSGFVAGTLVHTIDGLKPIEQIQIGDLVLSKPEDGSGEICYKPIVKIFLYENEKLWWVRLSFYGISDVYGESVEPDILSKTIGEMLDPHFITTPEHYVLVVGQGIWNQGSVSDFEAYPQSYWKCIDQLQEYEMIVNHKGFLFSIERAQPLFQFKGIDRQCVQPGVAWYQYNYYINEQSEDYEKYDLLLGRALGMEKYHRRGRATYLVDKVWDYNDLKNSYFSDIYNIEIEGHHTYFVGHVGIWVHQ